MNRWKGTLMSGVVASLVLFGNLAAWAGPYNSFVDQRLMSQEQRIQLAWQSGQLTPGEYQRLENQQQRLRMVESQMRADGHLDPAEKTRLNEMLNHSEWAIDRSTHKCWRPGCYRDGWREGWY